MKKKKRDLLCLIWVPDMPIENVKQALKGAGVKALYFPPCIGFYTRFYIRRRHALHTKKAFPSVKMIVSRHFFNYTPNS